MSIIIDTPFDDSSITSDLSTITSLIQSIKATAIRDGSQSVDPASANYLLNEDGTYVLDETGNRIVLEDGITAATNSYLLNEDGTYILDENGDRILLEESTDGPSLGSATPLMRASTPCVWVNVAARSTNTAVIWVGGDDIEENIGIPLYANEDSVHIPINNVNKIYILGLSGEGVTFSYGYNNTSSSSALENTDGTSLQNTDGTDLENTV